MISDILFTSRFVRLTMTFYSKTNYRSKFVCTEKLLCVFKTEVILRSEYIHILRISSKESSKQKYKFACILGCLSEVF